MALGVRHGVYEFAILWKVAVGISDAAGLASLCDDRVHDGNHGDDSSAGRV